VRTLLVIGNAFGTLGGAALSSLTFLGRLERDFGHRCLMLTRYPAPRREVMGGIEVAGYRDVEELKELVRRFEPDAMIGALREATDALRVARRYGVPAFLHVHSYEFCPPGAGEREDWGLPSAAAFPRREEAEFVLRSAHEVLAASRHLAGALQRAHNRPSEVLYCDFDTAETLLGPGHPRQPEYVTGVCGYRHKGLEVFLHLARAFPRERFLLAGALGSDIDLSYRRQLEAQPNLTLPGRLSTRELLARSSVVLVPSRWPEPFGRIAVEAMANGIPTLASRTGGLREILLDAPMGVEAHRDPETWSARLQAVLASPDLRAEYAEHGRALARPFLARNSSAVLAERLAAAARACPPDFSGRRIVAFHGDLDRAESDALVNRQWSDALRDGPAFAPAPRPSAFDLPDCTIHHDYTSPFTAFAPPDSGHCIAVRTSDFGPYPPGWAAKIAADFDQLWVHTAWIREQAVASGIDPARVRVVPLGIDPAIFRPDGATFSLPTAKSFRFLFVGLAVVRKGFDILLRAYREAFTRDDDVCLVVKDHSGNAFHSATYREEIAAVMGDPRAPALVYIDEFLPAPALAALYRSCQVAVFPYRAEGFCLPILEAMACGTPAIVPDLGAAVDFCSAETSFPIPALRIRLPVHRRFAMKIGVEEDIAAVDFGEVRVETLARALREVRALSGEQRRCRSEAGVRTARERFTWARSGARVAQLLEELAGAGPPVRLRRQRHDAETRHRQFETARRLALGLSSPPTP
jgi:glycosyltransferase involved in cell wall biosynthesis